MEDKTDEIRTQIILSVISSMLSLTAVLMQLCGTILVKALEEQNIIKILQTEAVSARNLAVERYRTANRRYTFWSLKKTRLKLAVINKMKSPGKDF